MAPFPVAIKIDRPKIRKVSKIFHSFFLSQGNNAWTLPPRDSPLLVKGYGSREKYLDTSNIPSNGHCKSIVPFLTSFFQFFSSRSSCSCRRSSSTSHASSSCSDRVPASAGNIGSQLCAGQGNHEESVARVCGWQ